MEKKQTRDNIAMNKRYERLFNRSEELQKRKLEDDKAETERRKRRRDHFLYVFQSKWDEEWITKKTEEVKAIKWVPVDREEVERKHFQKGDRNLNRTVDELDKSDDEIDPDDPYFGLTKEEIKELERLKREEEELAMIEKKVAEQGGIEELIKEKQEKAKPKKVVEKLPETLSKTGAKKKEHYSRLR